MLPKYIPTVSHTGRDLRDRDPGFIDPRYIQVKPTPSPYCHATTISNSNGSKTHAKQTVGPVLFYAINQTARKDWAGFMTKTHWSEIGKK